MGKQYIVTSVYVQGRQGSDEYVSEFLLEYSDDALTWRRYTNQLGIPEIFEGNNDDSSLQMRVLPYPVVARYVRFNPQRWNMVISLRVEVVGCPFEPDTASFDGESYIKYEMNMQAVQTTQDSVELRFRTGRPDGVLLYASGNQGDLFMLEISRGVLYFRIDLGSTTETKGLTEIKAASLLVDNQWHDVIITRDKQRLKVVVDRLINIVDTYGLFYRLDIDKYIFIGGVPYLNQVGITVKYNFIGCVQNINLNGAKLVRDAMSGTVGTITMVKNVNPYCNVVAKVPITFPTLESYLFITAISGRVIHVQFDFRTHDKDGLLVFHKMGTGTDATVTVTIDTNGFVKYSIVTLDGQLVEDLVRNNTSNTNRGFEGCIYCMQVDNIFPLKRAFQDPKPSNIALIPDSDKVREDMCSFEEITASPEPIQTRPFTGILQNVTYRRVTDAPLTDEEKALVGVGCALLIILIACAVLFCCRSRYEGANYETQEAWGAEHAENSDEAVVRNPTGLHRLPKTHEYLM